MSRKEKLLGKKRVEDQITGLSPMLEFRWAVSRERWKIKSRFLLSCTGGLLIFPWGWLEPVEGVIEGRGREDSWQHRT